MKIARQHNRHDALVSDALNPPHPAGRFDFAISIAVLHHLSTRERRVEGVKAALNTLKSPGGIVRHFDEQGQQHNPRHSIKDSGQALFFVWALEQKGSRRGWDEGGEQDVLVPWVLKSSTESSRQDKPENKTKKVGKKKKREGRTTEERNTTATAEAHSTSNSHLPDINTTLTDQVNEQAQTMVNDDAGKNAENGKTEQVYQRYYHLYHQGELEEDVVAAGGEVIQKGYDRDNWWCIAKKRVL